jgi:uncharacterized integral membrane protein (TIGR00697 family)
MNEFLFFVTILLNFGGILLAYKFFSKTGLFVWIGFATVIANIEVTKCVDMFGLSVTLGNVIYGTTFLATDILSEKHGGREARKGVLIGFFTTVVFTLMSQVNLLFVPNSEDVVSEAMKTVFSFMPRICIASVIAYLISNTLDTFTYDVIRKHFPNQLWLRNNGSTMTSQLIDSFLFTIIAFAGVFEWLTIIELSLTTYAIKIIVAACDTPFLYIAKHIKE